jgi:hypothetical protein
MVEMLTDTWHEFMALAKGLSSPVVSNRSQVTIGAYMVICMNNGHGCCELLLGGIV